VRRTGQRQLLLGQAKGIRRATVDDAETLARFNEAMAEETEDKTLDPDTVRAGVRAVFDTPEQAFYFVAERDGEVVGSLMITTEVMIADHPEDKEGGAPAMPDMGGMGGMGGMM